MTGAVHLPESSDFAPTDLVPVVRQNPETGGRELVQMRWGWKRPGPEGSEARSILHARSETVATRPMFQDAFRRRRCLVVADSFLVARGCVIAMADGQPFGIGAIWGSAGPRQGTPGCVVLTTEANEHVRATSERMPVIIAHETYDLWLDPDLNDLSRLEELMRSLAADRMVVRAAGIH